MLELMAMIIFALGTIQFAIILIEIFLLTLEFIFDWFDDYHRTRRPVASEIGFTLEEAERNGKVTYVQGVFNRATGEVKDARRISADRRSREVSELQGSNKVMIFT